MTPFLGSEAFVAPRRFIASPGASGSIRLGTVESAEALCERPCSRSCRTQEPFQATTSRPSQLLGTFKTLIQTDVTARTVGTPELCKVALRCRDSYSSLKP